LATHYEALGVSPTAEPEVIQGAYRALMRKYHPDANGGAYSDARAKRINEAYATLSDPGLRAAYDAQRRAADPPPRPQTAAQSETPAPPAQGFAATAPIRTADRKRAGLGWRLTALATIGLAAAGFAAGRLLRSTPTHQSQTAAAAPGQQTGDPAGGAKSGGAVSAGRAVAAIVSGDIVPRWRPDCSAGAGNAVVDVQVNLAPNGSLLSARLAGSAGDPSQLATATERARQAVMQAAPFALPRASYRQWRVFIVRFDTKDVCG
jgi:hypothetical protein